MNIDEKHFEFFRETHSGFSASISAINKSFNPLQNLPPKDSFPVSEGRNPLTTFEIGVKLRFAYLEKFLENNFFRTSLGSPYPIVEMHFTRGIAGILKSSYNYSKLSGSVSDYIKIPPYGSISYNVFAGKTFGTLPYVFLDIHPGNELYYYDPYAFNMMSKYEFISDRYAGINVEHNFGNGIFRLIPKLKFRQFWTAKVLWGSLSPENIALNFIPGNNFETLKGRTYMEVGTGVDNIFHVFRIDFIWRVLPATLDRKEDHPFGIFGSFKLSF